MSRLVVPRMERVCRSDDEAAGRVDGLPLPGGSANEPIRLPPTESVGRGVDPAHIDAWDYDRIDTSSDQGLKEVAAIRTPVIGRVFHCTRVFRNIRRAKKMGILPRVSPRYASRHFRAAKPQAEVPSPTSSVYHPPGWDNIRQSTTARTTWAI